ncbi:sensor histidine kinase [Isoptericola croceus]|uniref:sensor histidine kinase n=1 Tax=Isoptericola croceus TaxID=3031406 RepID=UPI0023F93ACC|nr:sensor histidine kinase [Isoptericola croceus]
MQRTGVRRLLDRGPAPGAAPPRRRDWLLGGALVTVAVLEGVLRTDVVWPAATVAVTVVALAALPWRRVHPLGLVALATLGGSALELSQLAAGHVPTTLYTAVALILAPYALFRWGSGRAIALGSVLLLGGFGVSALVPTGGTSDLLGGAAFLVLVAVLGELVRYRVAARSRDLDRARLHERARIARDLHDTLAHTLSAIAVRAQAGQVVATADPPAALDALRSVEQEARAALGEMRTIVGALRAEDDEPLRRPAPGLADLAALARPDGRHGPAVHVQVADDVGPVSATLATAVYRLAQEAVTNTRRHAATATQVQISLDRVEGSLLLRVHDDGPPVAAPPAAGHGLTGMAERAALLGGRCTAGPDPAGGWTVAATLPAGATS